MTEKVYFKKCNCGTNFPLTLTKYIRCTKCKKLYKSYTFPGGTRFYILIKKDK
ncbi:MAG: hypothetical protein ACOCP8_10340 [archaeon]